MTENALVLQAYRFALDPKPAQARMLRSHCGAQRMAFNWGLGLVKANIDQRAAERSYGLSEDELTPAMGWSAFGLRKQWNLAKEDIAPWWRENSKEAYASGLANLAAALSNWSGSRSGGRIGKAIAFPRFKSKRARLSCRFTTGAFGLADSDRRHVKLPRIGLLRTHESTRKLARRIEAGRARIRSATVSHHRGRWFVSFSVEVQHSPRRVARPDVAVGVDVGIRYLAVLSQPVPDISDQHGVVINPKHLNCARAELRRWQRQSARRHGPDKETGQGPSGRWLRTQARITRLHTRLANARGTGLHRLTTALAGRFGTIAVENLHVAGLLQNRRLARHIADAGWGELRRQLDYKTSWRGTTLVVANRWYPSSKTCSYCGVVKAKLHLSDHVFRCDACGSRVDRDVNAARNLAALAEGISGGASSQGCGATVNEPAGNPNKTNLVGRGYRHGKPHAGQRCGSDPAAADQTVQLKHVRR